MNIAKLKGLLASVPSADLHAGSVMGDKPGLLAGVTPVCRLPDGPVGEAYGALMLEAVNSLPALIQATEQRAGSSQGEPSPYSKDVRDRIEQQISTVLGMRPGAKGSNSIWSRLIWTNIEPHLVVPLPVLVDDCPDPSAGRIRKERSDAVLQFTCFMIAQLGTAPFESESDIAKLFERWETAHNSAAV